MSYPVTSEERLLKLYGFSLAELNKIKHECGGNKDKYLEKVEELDKTIAADVLKQITNTNLFVH